MKRLVSIIIASVLIMASPLVVSASAGDDGGLLDGLVDGIIEGLKDLFIPDEAFLKTFNEDIMSEFDRKTGGFVTAFDNVMDEFNSLNSGGQTNSTLTLTMPDNLLYNGYKGTKVNMLGGIGTFATWFKGLFSAFMVVTTIIQCYRKVISLFKE